MVTPSTTSKDMTDPNNYWPTRFIGGRRWVAGRRRRRREHPSPGRSRVRRPMPKSGINTGNLLNAPTSDSRRMINERTPRSPPAGACGLRSGQFRFEGFGVGVGDGPRSRRARSSMRLMSTAGSVRLLGAMWRRRVATSISVDGDSGLSIQGDDRPGSRRSGDRCDLSAPTWDRQHAPSTVSRSRLTQAAGCESLSRGDRQFTVGSSRAMTVRR